VWDERAFFNGYSHTKTVSEVAHRKTERLADAAAQRRKGSYERRERLDAVPPTPARPYRTAQRRARSRRRSRPPGRARLRALWRPGRTRVLVEIPWTGTRGLRRVCRGHSEHPDHPGYASKTNPTEYRFCEACGTAAALTPDGVCRSCFDGTEAAQ